MFWRLFLLACLVHSDCAFVPRSPLRRTRDATCSCGLAAARKEGQGRAISSFDTLETSPERPIVVVGATGKTGRIITKILAHEKLHVRAVTRTPNKELDNLLTPIEAPYVSYAVADVRQYESIAKVLQQQSDAGESAGAVIWAATSSGDKKGGGGTAAEVDYLGAYNMAKACLECSIPKLAFLSAACVTHPNAPGSKAVNWLTQFTYGDIPWTDAKIAGETAVRDLYKAAATAGKHNNKRNKNDNVPPAYFIVRSAAPLVNKPAVPVQDLMVLQGDLYSSGESISRINVAHMLVSALLNGGKATDFTTFEICPAKRLYKNEEGNALDLLGLPSLHQTNYPNDLPPTLVHRNADSYEALLDGLVTDDELAKKYKSIVTGYRAEGVPLLDEDSTSFGNPALQP